VLALADVTPEPVKLDVNNKGYHGIVGKDPGILDMCDLIGRVAPLPTSVMITGPTGSGKEVVARAIHAASDRKSKPFVAVNCTALSREILESELFGHVRGAFTGAVAPRKGRFREADGGTLLLDEIGDTTESFQTKLLRTLESGEIEPVGQDRPIKVNVRILCATNRNLEKLVREGRFREDLYYRINVVHVQVPPLVDRPGDLPLLVEMFRREFNQRFKKSIRLISQDAMRVLARHDWPGNVRELRHVLEHAFVVADGPTITRADLPPALTGATSARPASRAVASDAPSPAGSHAGKDQEGDDPPRAGKRGRDAEIKRIQTTLADCGGSIGEAAKQLEMHRTTLWRKMRQYGIET
jgi:two-component system response regulator HydG